jgi:Bax inhibitor 1
VVRANSILDRRASQGKTKLMAFGVVAALMGVSVAPLVNLAIEVDPTIVTTAMLLTAVVFASFSIIATVTSDRPMLWLGGALSSAIGWMMMASFINWFFRSQLVFMGIQVYGGLVLFSLYVIYDTQVIISRAEALSAAGQLSFDSAIHGALQLFTDLMAIFVRILIILLKNSSKKEKKRERS